jgi:katanin p60 ATPase-containing subunit A1
MWCSCREACLSCDKYRFQSAAALEREGGAPLSKLEAADNIDLVSVVKEFESYYEFKLGKKPKLVRKVDSDDRKENTRGGRGGGTKSTTRRPARADGLTPLQTDKYAAAASAAGVSSQQLKSIQSKLGTDAADDSTSVDTSGGAFGVSGSSMKVIDRRDHGRAPNALQESVEERLLKPLPFAGDPELRALAQTITRDIFQSNPGVNWDDGEASACP